MARLFRASNRSLPCTAALLILSLLILSGCGAAGPEPTPTPTKTPQPESVAEPQVTVAPVEAPTTVPVEPTPVPVEPTAAPVEPAPLPLNMAPYTGLTVDDPSLLRRRPVFICVNNDSVGRSVHEGLGLADVVYEYIVDGFTITRLTAMYHSRIAPRVGPVRSARYPNIWMTYMYDGVLACSGGSDAIRYLLKNEVGFPYLDADIDDPSNTVYFTNDPNGNYQTRLKLSTDGVRRWLSDNSLGTDAWSWPGFEFSEEPISGAVGTATVINIAYPGGNSVEWRYDAGQGGYFRFQGGQQQSDPQTGQPIFAKNVMAVVAVHELTDIVEDSLGTLSVDVKLYGFGDLRFFRDGQIYEGTWRADPENPPKWFGPGEVILKQKPGQSWIQVIRDKSEINYQ